MKTNQVKTSIGRLVGNDTGDPMEVILGFCPRYIEFYSLRYNYRAVWADCIPEENSVLVRNNSSMSNWSSDVFHTTEDGFVIGTLGLLNPGETLDFQAWG